MELIVVGMKGRPSQVLKTQEKDADTSFQTVLHAQQQNKEKDLASFLGLKETKKESDGSTLQMEESTSDDMHIDSIFVDESTLYQNMLTLLQAIKEGMKQEMDEGQRPSDQTINQLNHFFKQWKQYKTAIDEQDGQHKQHEFFMLMDENEATFNNEVVDDKIAHLLVTLEELYTSGMSASDIITNPTMNELLQDLEQQVNDVKGINEEHLTLEQFLVQPEEQEVISDKKTGQEQWYNEIKELEVRVDTSTTKGIELTGTALTLEIFTLLENMKQGLEQVLQQKDVPTKQSVKELLQLFEQWISRTRGMDKGLLQEQMSQTLSSKEKQIVEHLLARFEKRNYLAGQKMYQGQANITTKNVINWLNQALQQDIEAGVTHREVLELNDTNKAFLTQHTVNEEPLLNKMIQSSSSDLSMNNQKLASIHTPVQMSKVEQFTIHVQQMEKVEQVNQQLTDKLASILKESKFLVSSNQHMQLKISINPTNLGEMTVRFMQVKGEMSVQMLVTSQATKELLESNVHQLKSIFAPHQVVIERDEQVSDEEFFTEEDNQEEQGDEDQSHHGEQQKQDEASQEEKVPIDFQTLLQTLQMERSS